MPLPYKDVFLDYSAKQQFILQIEHFLIRKTAPEFSTFTAVMMTRWAEY